MCRYSATLGSMLRSSSYPRSTTACKRPLVIESLVAKSVTPQPRATSPSATLLATVSQAPYCRGGVRQATGERTATFLSCIIRLIDKSIQQPVDRDYSKASGGIGAGERYIELLIVNHGAAGVDHIGHVTVPLLFVRRDQRFVEDAKNFAGVIRVQQHGPNAVSSHRPHAMR